MGYASASSIAIRSAVLFLSVLLAAPAARAVDFKGVELGQPLWRSVERAAFGEVNCNPLGLDAKEYARYLEEMQTVMAGVRKVCTASTSIATVPADVTVLLGPSRRVLKLTFQFAGEHYSQVVSAMESKWGEGVIEVRDEQDRSVWWDLADGVTVSAHQLPAEEALGAVPYSVGLVEYSLPRTTPEADL